ncbi:MAG: polyprenyl synthetase family protein [Buchnera aphidicola (Nurudea shiraii)]
MDLFEFFNIKKKRINDFMRKLLKNIPFQDSLLVDAMKYGVLLGGKRIRSVLMYILGKIFQVNDNIVDILASSIEFMHAYSLIHDDLPSLDNDKLRRGYDSCYVKFGESTAILAGNALQCLSFNIISNLNSNIISDSKKVKMISELSHYSGISGMCIGQFRDLKFKYEKLKLCELEEIYWYKTGSLINTSVQLVLISSNINNSSVLLALKEYSKNISLAFQIRDDILDFSNDMSCISYHTRYEKYSRSNTFPLVIGLKKSQEKLRKLYSDALQSLKVLSSNHVDITLLKELAYFIIIRNK